MALSVFFCRVRNMVTLLPWLLYTDFSTSSYQCSLSDIALFPWVCTRGHSCRCTYCYFENNGHADIMSSIVPSCYLHSLHFLSVLVVFCCCIIFVLVSCTCTAITSSFSFCFQISPRYPQKCVIFTNKLPVYTSITVHSLLCFAIFLTTLLILFLYVLSHLFLLLIIF